MTDKNKTAWDGSTVHVESAIKADNPSREENIRTIASRLARFNALEIERDALQEVAQMVVDWFEGRTHNMPADRSAMYDKARAALTLATANAPERETETE